MDAIWFRAGKFPNQIADLGGSETEREYVFLFEGVCKTRCWWRGNVSTYRNAKRPNLDSSALFGWGEVDCIVCEADLVVLFLFF